MHSHNLPVFEPVFCHWPLMLMITGSSQHRSWILVGTLTVNETADGVKANICAVIARGA